MKDFSFKRLFIHLALAALVVASFGCIGWVVLDSLIMPRVARQGWPVVVVPSLEGLNAEQAGQKLSALGLEPTVDPVRRSSDRLAPDVVASQKPDAGDSVKQGHVVRIWLSAGATSIQVPDLAGRDSSQASKTLKESELVVADSIQWQESDAPYGNVISTQPKAGTILSRGSKVTLVLSAGDSTAAPADTVKPRIF